MSGVALSQQTLTESTTELAGHHASRRTRGGLVLAIVVTCQLMLILDATVMNVALPRIQADLHFSPSGLAWVMSAYTLTFGGLLLLGGRAGDLFGRRRMFVAGVTLFTLASLAGGFATSSAWLLVARILQGAGAAAAGPSTIALITTTFTRPRERIRALALLSAVASAGFAIGLILGGLLTQLGSWRWVLFINVPFGAAAAILAPRFVPEPPRHPGRLDLPGTATATAGMAALVYAFLNAASTQWSDRRTLVALAVGLVSLAAFLSIEARSHQPLVPLRLFADRDRAVGYANFFLAPAAMMSMFFFLTQFLQRVHGYGALSTGFAFMPMAVGMFALTRLVARLLPRFGPRALGVTGAVLMTAGLVWLTRLTAATGYLPGVFGPMLLMGVGGGIGLVPLNAVILSSVAPRDAGAASGVLQAMQQTGSSLGLAVLVTVFGTVSRHTSHGAGLAQHALVSGMTAAFAVAAAFIALTGVNALAFRGRTAHAS